MSLLGAFLLLVGLVLILVVMAVVAAALSGDLRGFLKRFISGDAAAGRGPASPSSDEPRYRIRQGLLTPAEGAFFPVVESVLPDLAQHLGAPAIRAFAKVRLADLIEPDCKGGPGSSYMSLFGRIKSKHVDAVLVDAVSFHPLCIIELDDQSHNTKRAQKSDAVKDAACRSASLPLVRIRAQSRYDRREVGRAIAAAMAEVSGESPFRQQQPAPAAPAAHTGSAL
jgi:hypothetical protein